MQGAGVLLLNTYASFRPKSILSHTNQLPHPPGSSSPPGNFNPLPTVLTDFSCPRVRCALQLLWPWLLLPRTKAQGSQVTGSLRHQPFLD